MKQKKAGNQKNPVKKQQKTERKMKENEKKN